MPFHSIFGIARGRPILCGCWVRLQGLEGLQQDVEGALGFIEGLSNVIQAGHVSYACPTVLASLHVSYGAQPAIIRTRRDNKFDKLVHFIDSAGFANFC